VKKLLTATHNIRHIHISLQSKYDAQVFQSFPQQIQIFFAVNWIHGTPAVTFGPPPCFFSARTVATKTTADGIKSE
jgi:hypothetical protein